jgi:hypothetical protein
MIYIGLVGFVFSTLLIDSISTFYIPGVAPLDFRRGENVEVKVGRYAPSTRTQRTMLLVDIIIVYLLHRTFSC